LPGIVDFADDVARLKAVSQRELQSLAGGLVTIPGPAGPIRIERDAVRDIVAAGNSGPLLVVGEPGIAKTVASHDLVVASDVTGMETLFLPIGSFTATSIG
jgi:MoxR-like ATPase